jgi:hypothetical protein
MTAKKVNLLCESPECRETQTAGVLEREIIEIRK